MGGKPTIVDPCRFLLLRLNHCGVRCQYCRYFHNRAEFKNRGGDIVSMPGDISPRHRSDFVQPCFYCGQFFRESKLVIGV